MEMMMQMVMVMKVAMEMETVIGMVVLMELAI